MTKAPHTRQDVRSFQNTNNPEAVAVFIIANPHGLRNGGFMYDYREAITSDVLDHIKSEFTKEEIKEKLSARDDWEQELNDDLWARDNVTGNGSGSYTFNAWQAEEYLAHNWDLLADAIDEFGGDADVLRVGPEACDVTIRCYLLAECISDALDQLEEEQEVAQ